MKETITIAFLQNIGPAESIILFLPLIFLALTLGCLIHCGMNQRMNGTEKGIWILVVFLIPFFGSIAYLAFGRKGSNT
tara:strand:- start:145 stop:378 length:234 start_codon:yes stop_codon:yes gene_type:complete